MSVIRLHVDCQQRVEPQNVRGVCASSSPMLQRFCGHMFSCLQRMLCSVQPHK
jgi:hypothetical protein